MVSESISYISRLLEIHCAHIIAVALTSLIYVDRFTLIGFINVLLFLVALAFMNNPKTHVSIMLTVFVVQLVFNLFEAVWIADSTRSFIVRVFCGRQAPTISNNRSQDCVITSRVIGNASLTSIILWIGPSDQELLIRFIAKPIVLFVTFVILILSRLHIERYRKLRTRSVFKDERYLFEYSRPDFSVTLPPYSIRNRQTNEHFIPGLPSYSSHDSTMSTFVQFVINFFFHRFSLEVMMATLLTVAAIRSDCIALAYVATTAMIASSKRKFLSKNWIAIPIIVAWLVIVEYAYRLRLETLRIFGYPIYIDMTVSKLFIVDRTTILGDCIVLFMSVCQLEIFRVERFRPVLVYAGDNFDATTRFGERVECFDFTESIRNGFDILRRLIYYHGIVISVLVLYLAATSNINFFCLAYLLMSFGLLYRGNDLLYEPRQHILRVYNCGIACCFLFLIVRICFHMISCTVMHCWFNTLFGSKCHLKAEINNLSHSESHQVTEAEMCPYQETHTMITDCVCLIFLLLQRRAFRSHSFDHVLTDLTVSSKLTAEGAKIYSTILADQFQRSHLAEETEINKISASIERIKVEEANLLERAAEQLTHFQAIRAFNHHMFNSSPDRSTNIFEISKDDVNKEDYEDYYSVDNELVENNFRFLLDRLIEYRRTENPSGQQSPSISKLITHNIKSNNAFFSDLLRKTQSALAWLLDSTIVELRKQANIIKLVDERLSSKKARLKSGESESSIDNMTLVAHPISKRKSTMENLLNSIYLFVAANSAGVCYALMILCHASSGSLFSLLLSLWAILWGMLCVPRPPSIYWKFVVGYTEVTIILKYIIMIIRNHLIPTNPFMIATLKPISFGYLFGLKPVNTSDSRMWECFNLLEIVLLIALSFHKGMLKNLNLWNNKFGGDRASFCQYPCLVNNEIQPSVLTRIRKTILRTFNPSNDCLPVRDYYTQMFYADIAAIVIIVVFYDSFGEATETDVVTSLKKDKVPVAFLILLVVQFLCICVDRAIYLMKSVRTKIIFYFLQVTVVHIWIYFLLPMLKDRNPKDNTPAQLLYVVKCIYFALSAKQIKCGYPSISVGSIYSTSYSYFKLVKIKAMLYIPFFYEIRTLMAWLFTESCLNITHWFYLEDIYAHVFITKCWRELEKRYPTPRGHKHSLKGKFATGGSLLIALVTVIWSPLLLFSLSWALFEENPPSKVEINLRLGPYPPIFTAFFDQRYVRRLSNLEYDQLKMQYKENKHAIHFIRDFKPSDISYVHIPVNSTNRWVVSPPALEKLKEDAIDGKIYHEFRCLISSKRASGDSSTLHLWRTFVIEKSVLIEDGPNSLRLVQMLTNQTSNLNMTLHGVYPSFIYLKTNHEAVDVEALRNGGTISYYKNLTYSIDRDNSSMYWSIIGDFVFLVFSDRVSPPKISFLTKYGIFGIYTTFVFVLGRFCRTFSQTSRSILYNELPNVDRLLQLILDIYTVRQKKMFDYEELLYSKLLFLYRSPEALFDFTHEQ